MGLKIFIILGKNVNPKNLQEKNILESKNKVLSFPSQSFRLHKYATEDSSIFFNYVSMLKKKKAIKKLNEPNTKNINPVSLLTMYSK